MKRLQVTIIWMWWNCREKPYQRAAALTVTKVFLSHTLNLVCCVQGSRVQVKTNNWQSKMFRSQHELYFCSRTLPISCQSLVQLYVVQSFYFSHRVVMVTAKKLEMVLLYLEELICLALLVMRKHWKWSWSVCYFHSDSNSLKQNCCDQRIWSQQQKQIWGLTSSVLNLDRQIFDGKQSQTLFTLWQRPWTDWEHTGRSKQCVPYSTMHSLWAQEHRSSGKPKKVFWYSCPVINFHWNE